MKNKARAETRRLNKLLTQIEQWEQGRVKLHFDNSIRSRRDPSKGAADIAEINYRGNTKGTLPARPFFEVMAAQGAPAISQKTEDMANMVIQGNKTTKQALRLVANEMVRQLRHVLLNGDKFFISNAESTVKKKGFDKALFETRGLLIPSIRATTYVGE